MRALITSKLLNLLSKLQIKHSIIILFIVIFSVIIFPVTAEPLSTADHLFNPALLSTGHRFLFEVGTSLDLSVSNNYMSIQDIFTEQIIIDMDEMYDQLKDSGLRFANQDIIESHFLLSLFGLSIGAYMTLDGLATLNIPGTLVGLFANGNEIDTEYTSAIDTYSQIFLETGIYAGYKLFNFQFSTKLGIFAPVFYSDSGNIETSLSTDSETGITSASAQINVPVYTAFNFEEISELTPEALLESIIGMNIDIGAIYMEGKKAIAGIHVNNIPIKPSYANNMMNMSMSMSETVSNPLGNFDNDEEEMLSQEFSELSILNSEVQKEISIPIEIGAFYRMTFLPVIDFIFKGDLIFTDILRYSFGIDAIVELWILPSIFMGVEYNQTVWEFFLGLRQDLRIIEIGLDIGLTAPDILSMLSIDGLSAKLYIAVGI